MKLVSDKLSGEHASDAGLDVHSAEDIIIPPKPSEIVSPAVIIADRSQKPEQQKSTIGYSLPELDIE